MNEPAQGCESGTEETGMLPVQADELAALRAIVEGTARSTGEAFFQSLVRHLASAVDAHYAFVAEFANPTANTRVRTIAFWEKDRIAENIEWALAGTPCEDVVRGNLCHHPIGVAREFPEDKPLIEWRIESYLGVPLCDASGRVLGHLAVFDERPMPAEPRRLLTFRIFAARAAAELERLHFERRLAESEKHYRDLYGKSVHELKALLELNIAIGHHLRRDEMFGAAAATLRNLLEFDRFGIELPIAGDRLQEHLLTPTGGAARQPTRVQVLPAQGTACDWVLKNRQWLVASSRDELHDRFPLTFEVMTQEGMESLCAMPLISGGQSRGVLFFMAARQAAYGNLPQGLFDQVASAVAVALDDCLAHEELRRYRDQLAAENVYLQEEIKAVHNFEEIIGQSPKLAAVLDNVRRVAPTDAAVLISGETGTGKELVARAIHFTSKRKDKPLIKVNCAALPSGLVESELFGHEKGAFTGAITKQTGRFELADGGTIFLDEIGDLPADAQAKLLRVLQEHEFDRVGGKAPIKVDVRVIAATNRNLLGAVREKKFREDLFYRLNVFPIQLPPLRERTADIPLLVHFMVTKFATRIGKQIEGVSRQTMERLLAYPWPGNVRELENILERAVILAPSTALEIGPDILACSGVEAGEKPQSSLGTLEDVERNHILAVLEQTDWVIDGARGAARILELNPNTLRSRMKKLAITRIAHEVS